MPKYTKNMNYEDELIKLNLKKVTLSNELFDLIKTNQKKNLAKRIRKLNDINYDIKKINKLLFKTQQ